MAARWTTSLVSFGVHGRTVADHFECLGIPRRVNLPKLTPRGIERAISQYEAGDSLATVGKTLSFDASTVQRAIKRAGFAIRHGPDAEGAPGRRKLQTYRSRSN
jgi:hypothetical protein